MKKTVLCAIFFLFSVTLFSQVLPSPQGFVNDFAGIIPSDIKVKLVENLSVYEQSTSIEIAIVTVSSLDGYEIEDYSIKLANTWGVGKKINNGLIILIAPNERRWRIEVGYALEPYVTDYAAKDIGDGNFPELFREEKYGEGIFNAVVAIEKKLGTDAWTIREENRKAQEKLDKKRNQELFDGFLAVLSVVVLIAFFGWIGYLIKEKIRKMKENRQEAANTLVRLADTYKSLVSHTKKLQTSGFKGADTVLEDLEKTKRTVDLFISKAPKGKSIDVIEAGSRLIGRLEAIPADLFEKEENREFALAVVKKVPETHAAMLSQLKESQRAFSELKKEAPKKIWGRFDSLEDIAKAAIQETKEKAEKIESLVSMDIQKFKEAKKLAASINTAFGNAMEYLNSVVNKKNEWERAKKKFNSSSVSKSKKDDVLSKKTDDGIIDYIAAVAVLSTMESHSSHSSDYSSSSSSSNSDSGFSFGGGSFGGGGASGSW